MSLIKVPSWFELFKPRQSFGNNDYSFWKEQSLRFGFDIRKIDTTVALDSPWRSFFYENFFEFSLKKIGWNKDELSLLERMYWKRNGKYLEKLRLDLQCTSYADLARILPWLPELKVLELSQTNRLLQTVVDDSLLHLLPKLHTVLIHDVHLVSKNALLLIPKSVQRLIIRSCRKIDPGFFEALQEYHELKELVLEASGGIESHLLCKLPKQLKSLDLSHPLHDIATECLELLPKTLETLKLNSWHSLTDKDLVNFSNTLSTLELDGSKLTSQGLKILGGLPLKKCSLRAVRFADFNMNLSFLPKTLASLDISENGMTLDDLAPLGQYTSLETLRIESTPAFASSALFFPQGLKELSLKDSRLVSKATLQGLKKLYALKKLDLSGCQVENEDIEWLPQNLEELDLGHCPAITDTGVSMMKHLSTLQTVILDRCEQIRGFGLASLSESVKKLSLAGCHRLSGKCLVSLPQALEELYLDACELLASQDTKDLPTTLQVLHLTDCPNITNDAIDHLTSLPLLHTLNIQTCPKITQEGILLLERNKFEGILLRDPDADSIEHHPPMSILKKMTNFKAKLINRLE